MKSFPEFKQMDRILERLNKYAQIDVVAQVHFGGEKFPLYTIVLGNRSEDVPTLGLTGGVHGLERIGSHVVLSYLEHLLERLSWDESLLWQLERMKIAIMPIVNPVGVKNFWRSNGNGVDLMRNAPVNSEEATFLVGGHRISPHLPWYRGNPAQMEVEAQALVNFIKKECFKSPHSIVVDLHSGFGVVDQLWFPYASKSAPFPNLAEVSGLKILLDRVLPNHVYKFEPQAIHYRTHGDLWDYLYDEFMKENATKAAEGRAVFLPLTLELGSWSWVRKNPFQFFTKSGHYNPLKPHRMKRALRRHIPLFDFLMRSVVSPSLWKVGPGEARHVHHEQGLLFWYRSGLQRLLPPSMISKK